MFLILRHRAKPLGQHNLQELHPRRTKVPQWLQIKQRRRLPYGEVPQPLVYSHEIVI